MYKAARTGSVSYLRELLQDLSPSRTDHYLSSLYRGAQGSCTPLMISARNGHSRMVSTLLCKYRARVDLEGSLLFEHHYFVQGVTALWCAVEGGHVDAARSLLLKGADVNHRTQRWRTPLTETCFTAYDKTCLMLAAQQGDCAMVTCLLEHGAHFGATAPNGETALHFAARKGHESSVKVLLAFEAQNVRNCYGETPLLQAAEWLQEDVVHLFFRRLELRKAEKVEALELLGAAFANDESLYNPQKAFTSLANAMALRCSGDDPLPKQALPMIPAYGQYTECASMEDLAILKGNPERLQIESLYIRERILGWHTPSTPRRMIIRASALRQNGRFLTSIQLWTRVLDMKTCLRVSLYDDIVEVTDLLCQMLHYGIAVPPEFLCAILEASASEAQYNGSHLVFSFNFDKHMHTLSYLIFIAANIYSNEIDRFCPLGNAIRRVVSLNLRTLGNHRTLLHLCLDENTSTEGEYVKEIVHFPNELSAGVLLRAGHDVNSQDAGLSTPLHVISRTRSMQPAVNDTVRESIRTLVDAGAHTDLVDLSQRTPADVALDKANRVALSVLRYFERPQLKCIASRAVNRYGLRCGVEIPETLKEFVRLHGS